VFFWIALRHLASSLVSASALVVAAKINVDHDACERLSSEHAFMNPLLTH
jgi:hypothetical protein